MLQDYIPPYELSPGNRGLMRLPYEEYVNVSLLWAECGYQVLFLLRCAFVYGSTVQFIRGCQSFISRTQGRAQRLRLERMIDDRYCTKKYECPRTIMFCSILLNHLVGLMRVNMSE